VAVIVAGHLGKIHRTEGVPISVKRCEKRMGKLLG